MQNQVLLVVDLSKPGRSVGGVPGSANRSIVEHFDFDFVGPVSGLGAGLGASRFPGLINFRACDLAAVGSHQIVAFGRVKPECAAFTAQLNSVSIFPDAFSRKFFPDSGARNLRASQRVLHAP